jgi:hypothetical protein
LLDAFSFFGEPPPGMGFTMLHKMNGSHEHINDAGVNCLAFHQAKLGMQLKWIFPDQLVGMLYALIVATAIEHGPSLLSGNEKQTITVL